jgi:hypothetical protein
MVPESRDALRCDRRIVMGGVLFRCALVLVVLADRGGLVARIAR